MNTFSFINSPDISKYLQSINYKFNSLETAWLIYQCKTLSFAEKNNNWLELIDSMPDCSVPKRINCHGWDSLHGFLEKYIEVNESIFETFSANENNEYVFMFSYLYEEDDEWTENFQTSFGSYEQCMKYFEKELDTFCETKEKIVRYRVKKQSLIDPNKEIVITYMNNSQPESIFYESVLDKNQSNILWDSFEGLWFDFPTPFEKGDLVCFPDWKLKRELMVLENLSTWQPTMITKEAGDNTDMWASGIFVQEDGTVYSEGETNYMDLEYYNGELKDSEKILFALSKFKKGKLELELLLETYRHFIIKNSLENKGLQNIYIDEILVKLGLK